MPQMSYLVFGKLFWKTVISILVNLVHSQDGFNVNSLNEWLRHAKAFGVLYIVSLVVFYRVFSTETFWFCFMLILR